MSEPPRHGIRVCRSWSGIVVPWTLAVLLVGTLSIAAFRPADPPAVDPMLRGLLAGETAALTTSRLPIIREKEQDYVAVWLRGPVSRAGVEELGATVHTVAGPVMTAHVPMERLDALVQLPGLRQVQLAQPVEFQTDVSIPECGIDQAWGGPPPGFSQAGLTGAGVVLGIIDTGIDPGHADFKIGSASRIEWIWDQSFGLSGPSPGGFNYGSEYSKAAVEAGTYDGVDDDGHGTLVAGIAGGNGRATGNGVPMYTYMGAAPNAELVIVKLKTDLNGVLDTWVIDAVDYVFQKAAAAGKPAVVLLALGKLTGPHDGQDPLDLGISALTGPGKVVVAPVGNFGGLARHAEWTSTGMNQTGDMTVLVDSYTFTGEEVLRGEAWYDASANYSVSVLTPSGQVIGPVSRGSSTIVGTSEGFVQVSNGAYTSADGSYRVDLDVWTGGSTSPPMASGTWTYRFKSNMSSTDRVDAWITLFKSAFSDPPEFVQNMTEARLTTSPATADGVVAVAAYSTKRNWTALGGGTYGYYYAVLNDIADFSAPGPRRDDVPGVRVAGPGYGVAGALSSATVPSSIYIMPDGVHRIDFGTSVAAAHVAGIVALMLEANPTSTSAEAGDFLEQIATVDGYTGTVPNARWGGGKLYYDGFGATTGVLDDIPDDPASTPQALAVFPNPTRSAVHFEFALSQGDLASGATVRLRILDVLGREVAVVPGRLTSETQRLTWDGRAATGQEVGAGIYFGRLETGTNLALRKIIRIQ